MDFKQYPTVARARLEMAQAYRSMRRDNPKLARLVFRRMKMAEAKFIDALWHTDGADQIGGLASLVGG